MDETEPNSLEKIKPPLSNSGSIEEFQSPKSHKPLIIGLVILVVLLTTAMAYVYAQNQSLKSQLGSSNSCEYEGQSYQMGDSFPASDGCNSCSCEEDGKVSCTLRDCIEFTENQVITPSVENTKLAYPKLASEFFFSDITYPEEILSLKFDETAKVSCGEQFFRQVDNKFIDYSVNQDGQEYPNQADLNMINQFLDDEELNEEALSFIQTCAGDKNLLIFGISQMIGGGGNDVYVSEKRGGGKLNPLKIKVINGQPYFSCSNIIAATNDGRIYLQCGAGDGGFGAASLFKLDFKERLVDMLISCTSLVNFENDKPEVTCDES